MNDDIGQSHLLRALEDLSLTEFLRSAVQASLSKLLYLSSGVSYHYGPGKGYLSEWVDVNVLQIDCIA